MATVRTSPTTRRVVRRRARPAVDRESRELSLSELPPALSELPAELHLLVVRYADNLREGQEIRSALCTEMTRCGVRWWTVNNVAHKLV